MALHPANNGRKSTVRGLNQLPVPKSAMFRASLESIDQSSILDNVSRSKATIKTRLKFKGAFRLFSVHRLLAAHLRKQKIRHLAQRLFAWSVEHVLNNAIAYTDRKGRITVEAEGDEAAAVIRIGDNGSGIATKDLPRVFNRFDRVVEAGVRGEAALGLGLPLTRQFIEAHGGTVELQSKKGKGTTVTLNIPRGSK